ncbi:DUF4888 domain-containing protein [Staphylococcus aureus]|uniref:DUF4888 domain-containing protein n=1 Tax=Staphylococcus aureus TaxID=1280 RepID=UPI0013AFEBE2|nr:DUF4888 domain-containing protein [Staphylococcus aureus]NDQ28546.1 DUF4888 domain-containing protein [Staphylococcus aureus]
MNTKFLGKTLVASALVLTTLGTGLHSSYLGLDTNKVVKTAKAEENMTEGQLWKKVKDSLIDSQIISGNNGESVKVTYSNGTGQSNSVESTGNQTGDVFSTPSNFSKLNNINITRQNVGEEDFNKVLNGNTTWNTLTEKLESKGLITKGQKVTIHSNSTTVSGVVGEKLTNSNDINLEKRFSNKITIE